MKKNILFLHRGGDIIRGTEETLITLASNKHNQDFNYFILCNNQNMLSALSDTDAESHIFQIPEVGLNIKTILSDMTNYFSAFRQLSNYIKKINVDLIVCNGGLPCQLAIPLGKLKKIPVVCYFHHPATRRYYHLWLLKYTNYIIYASESTKSHVEEHIRTLNSVIYFGLNLDKIKPIAKVRELSERQKLGFSENDIVISQIGALVPHKRVDLLIDAFEEIYQASDNTKLLIIGDGPLKQELVQKAKETTVSDSIIFTGFVDSIDTYLEHVVDIHVLASECEGLGITLLQASAMGIVNLAANNTGMKEAVSDNETGYLFETGNKVDLGNKLLDLVTNEEARERMGKNGIEYVEQKFNLSNYVKNMEDIFLRN